MMVVGGSCCSVGFSPGGFVSARTRNLEPALDLSGYKGIKLR